MRIDQALFRFDIMNYALMTTLRNLDLIYEYLTYWRRFNGPSII